MAVVILFAAAFLTGASAQRLYLPRQQQQLQQLQQMQQYVPFGVDDNAFASALFRALQRPPIIKDNQVHNEVLADNNASPSVERVIQNDPLQSLRVPSANNGNIVSDTSEKLSGEKSLIPGQYNNVGINNNFINPVMLRALMQRYNPYNLYGNTNYTPNQLLRQRQQQFNNNSPEQFVLRRQQQLKNNNFPPYMPQKYPAQHNANDFKIALARLLQTSPINANDNANTNGIQSYTFDGINNNPEAVVRPILNNFLSSNSNINRALTTLLTQAATPVEDEETSFQSINLENNGFNNHFNFNFQKINNNFNSQRFTNGRFNDQNFNTNSFNSGGTRLDNYDDFTSQRFVRENERSDTLRKQGLHNNVFRVPGLNNNRFRIPGFPKFHNNQRSSGFSNRDEQDPINQGDVTFNNEGGEGKKSESGLAGLLSKENRDTLIGNLNKMLEKRINKPSTLDIVKNIGKIRASFKGGGGSGDQIQRLNPAQLQLLQLHLLNLLQQQNFQRQILQRQLEFRRRYLQTNI